MGKARIMMPNITDMKAEYGMERILVIFSKCIKANSMNFYA